MSKTVKELKILYVFLKSLLLNRVVQPASLALFIGCEYY